MESISSSELAQLRLFADPHAADKLKRERERGNELQTKITKLVSENSDLSLTLSTSLQKTESAEYFAKIFNSTAISVSARASAEEALSNASDVCAQIDIERGLVKYNISVLVAEAKALLLGVISHSQLLAASKKEHEASLREAALHASIVSLKNEYSEALKAAEVDKQSAVSVAIAEKAAALNEQRKDFEEQMKEASVVAAVTKQSREDKAKAASEAKLEAERKANEAQKRAKQLQDEVEILRSNADAQRSVSKSARVSSDVLATEASVTTKPSKGKTKNATAKSKKRKANELEESFQEVIEFISSPPAAAKLASPAAIAPEDVSLKPSSVKPSKKPSQIKKLGAKTLKTNKASDGGDSDDSDDRISSALISKSALEASKPFAQKKPPKAGGKRSMLIIPDDDAERAGRLSLGSGRPSSSSSSSPPPPYQNTSSDTATAVMSSKKTVMSARKAAVSTTAVVVSNLIPLEQPLAPPPAITINVGAGAMPAFKLPGGIPAFKMPSKAPSVSVPIASTSQFRGTNVPGAGRLELDSITSAAPIPGALMSRPLFKMPKLK
jgi:hypothetical protein